MIAMAGRREGARHREQHHLLALEQIIRGFRFWPIGGHHHETAAGYAVANLNRHDPVLSLAQIKFRPLSPAGHKLTASAVDLKFQ
jgi:hypothetical protein